MKLILIISYFLSVMKSSSGRYRWALETSDCHEERTMAVGGFLCHLQVAVTFVDADRENLRIRASKLVISEILL